MKEHNCWAEVNVQSEKGLCSLLGVGINCRDMFFIKGTLSLVCTAITAVCLKYANRM